MSIIQERRSATLNQQMVELSDDFLRKACPSIFAEAPRSDVSSRYGFVSSHEVLKAMREEGFVPTHARDYMRRNTEQLEFTKHMVRFRQAGSNLKKLTVGDVVPQVIMVNSHDRSSQFHLFGGLFRLICSNGMMVSESSVVKPIIVRHTVTAVDGVLAASRELVKQQAAVFEHVDIMKSTMLTEKAARQFASDALDLRPARAGAIDSTLLLSERRADDKGLSVWKVYNRVQENLMRGGLAGVTTSNRAIVTRGVDSINADLHINAGLWRLAMEAINKASMSSRVAVPA